MKIKGNSQICPLCGRPYPNVTSGWYHNCLNINIDTTGCASNNFPNVMYTYV